MSTKENQNRIMARKIADALFTDYNGEANRLAMKHKRSCGGESEGGGWCKKAVIDQILKVLNSWPPKD